MGFYVLLGFVGYVALALFIAKLMTGWKVKLTTLLVFMLIPTWDIPLGLWELDRLCKKEAGQHVYRTITLSDEYRLKPGEYNSGTGKPALGGELNYPKIRENYQLDLSRFTTVKSLACKINKTVTRVTEIATGEVLGEARSFSLTDCWFMNWAKEYFAPPSVMKYCPDNARPGFKDYLHSNVVRKILGIKENE